MIAAYREVGSYRGAAADLRHHPQDGEVGRSGAPSGRGRSNEAPGPTTTTTYATSWPKRIERDQGPDLGQAPAARRRAAGYEGSARNLRRLVAEEKVRWRREHHRGRRPGVWSPGEMLMFDWGQNGPLMSSAPWWPGAGSASSLRRQLDGRRTTLRRWPSASSTSAACPKSVLADRMGCLKAATVADVVVPTPAYVRFATHYGFGPTSARRPTPSPRAWSRTSSATRSPTSSIPDEVERGRPGQRPMPKRTVWCDEVNARRALARSGPSRKERLEIERPLFSPLPHAPALHRQAHHQQGGQALVCPVRFGPLLGADVPHRSAEVANVEVADGATAGRLPRDDHRRARLVAPGETSVCDDHYGGPRPRPRRAVRPRLPPRRASARARSGCRGVHQGGRRRRDASTLAERAARARAARGRLRPKPAVVSALERAVVFGRCRAGDVRSILGAGAGVSAGRPPATP